jgi:hypothetical protein
MVLKNRATDYSLSIQKRSLKNLNRFLSDLLSRKYLNLLPWSLYFSKNFTFSLSFARIRIFFEIVT